ncbi:TIGR02221 family CRISPR-associated protein [Conchiformibius kuhniae]|uniref:TIGR02221 family CRISPR-associated protein n=1 Tax=Conchiformibius kuhniae TaxID=211502 RepID=A0A8T9MSL5_9NEIS|nr:TIGR02221 family CRISPR-associated protein [Conchiformibius kuhniae]UOP04597.1 TIGR02221 family CRISPR-associated protein [Conchiformibius kuhniae]
MHTLISFLGFAQKGYVETEYDFNGEKFKTKFIGAGLTQILQPQQLLLVGTAGSMWDVLLQDVANDKDITALMDAVEKKAVTEALLQPCLPKMREKFGCEVKFIIIEYARTEAEQISLLQRIADELNENDSISIDVTHSFRHLPMLALVASRFLGKVKNIATRHICYGALNMPDGNPVIELSGMLKMLDWVDALAVYNHNGSYHEFAGLFRREQASEAAECLENAAFYENTNQIHQARGKLDSFHHLVLPDNPLIGLFKPELDKRTGWAKHNDYARRQLENAKLHLDKGDYLRATVLAYEAWLSKMTYAYKGDMANYHDREQAENHFTAKMSAAQKADFDCLNHIRNALAHGTQPGRNNRRVQAALKDSETLRRELSDAVRTIGQWQPD